MSSLRHLSPVMIRVEWMVAVLATVYTSLNFWPGPSDLKANNRSVLKMIATRHSPPPADNVATAVMAGMWRGIMACVAWLKTRNE
jgi:hypothetical protein